MKFSLTNRLYIGFAVAILLVFLVGILSYKTFQRQSEAGKQIEHTYQVLNKTAAIEKLLIDMETGRINYRSTGVRQFLKPYDDALLNIRLVLKELQELTADNLLQTERVHRIVANVETLLVFWNIQPNEQLRQYNQTAFIDLINQQKEFTDVIKEELAQVIRTERLLLTQRENENKASIEQATYELILGSLLTLVIVLALIYLTIQGFNSHRKAEANLQENFKELEHLNVLSIEKNWLLTGMSVINDSMEDINDVTSLTQSILNTITTYLNLPASAFYCFNATQQELELNTAVALPANVRKIYQVGEGFIGQAATTHAITIVNDIPDTFWGIQAGSGYARPGQLVFVPLWYNKDLKGVIELAAFKPLNEQALLLLKSVTNSIAVAINAADDHERVMTLLQQIQEQKEELENQQEELQQSNEELTRQAEILQLSEQELKVQEEELRQINAELLERNKAVEIAQKELTIKAKELEVNSKYKSEFLANMSHELRTPLNSVLILARLLAENKQRNLTGKQIEYANIIHKSGTDLLELINDILDLSKIEAGKVELLFEQTSVSGITNDMNQLFSVVADEKGVNLSIQVGHNVPTTIWTDKQRLEQIIKNLLSNAVKFTPKGGSVTLALQVIKRLTDVPGSTAATAQPVLAISVTDTGIGISPEKQQIIFEAFQQVDGSISRKFGGTGLGLSISKELIRKLGAELGLQSEVGRGSTFTIYLPITSSPDAESSQQTDSPYHNPIVLSEPAAPFYLPDDRQNLVPGDKVILIIGDDPIWGAIIQDAARKKVIKTIIASQSDEGIQYARQYRPSAIILAMSLATGNGNTILDRLKNDETLTYIPVQVMSTSISGQNAAQSNDRLMDELVHFFQKINQPAPPTLPIPVAIDAPQEIQGKKVLLVDDDMRNVFALSTLLEANQMTVVTAGDGQEALQQLNDHPDTAIVLMDIMMPEMDGYEATRRIRTDKRFMRLPVIALTAKAMTSDREKCLEAGASDYITKPVDSTQLFSLMRLWLS